MATTLTGTLISSGADTDLSLCRISGYLRDVSGSPLKGYAILIRHVYNPIGIVPDSLVLRERKVYRTDEKGFIQFDLLQGATVDIEIPNRLFDHVLHRTVPELSSIDLVDFLFPHVVTIEFVTSTPQALEVGDTLVVSAVANLSNGDAVALTSTSTTLESSDSEIVERTAGFIFTALATGSITISMTDFNSSALELLLEPSEAPIYLLSTPTLVLPDDIVVTVT